MKVKEFRSGQKDFERFSTTQSELSACKKAKGLMATMNVRQIPQEWRPFIHLFMHSLKAVFLNKGSVMPSVPDVYNVHDI